MKKILIISIAIACFLLAMTFQGCNEEPTEIGYSLKLDTIELHPLSSMDTTLITSAVNEYHRPDYMKFDAFLCGKYMETKAYAFIVHTNVPDTLGDLTEANILSAKIRFPLNRYVYGDSTQNPSALSFKVYRVLKYWTSAVTIDSIGEDLMSSGYIDPFPLAEFSGPIEQKDSMGTIEIELNKGIIADWMRYQSQIAGGDSSEVKYGLAIVPDESSTAIRQFATETYSDSTDRESQIIYEYKIDMASDETFVDTLLSGFSKSFVNATKLDDSQLMSQGGVHLVSRMTFDMSMIPHLAGIHRARLTMYLDKENSSWGNDGLDSLLACNLLVIDSLDKGDVYYKSFDAALYIDSLNAYNFNDVAPFIRYWDRDTEHSNIDPEKKRCIVDVMPYFEKDLDYQTDRMIFYGLNHPDINLRPRLTVIYSTRPELNQK